MMGGAMTDTPTPSGLTQAAVAAPLLVRLHNWIGDVVVGLPALQLLADHGVPLQLVGKGWAASLLAGPGWPVHPLPQGLRPRVALWRGLRRQQQGAAPGAPDSAARPRGAVDALLLATSFSAALEPRLAGLKTMGYATDHRRWLLQRAAVPATGPHALQGYWQLACQFLDVQRAPPADIGLTLTPAATAHAAALRAGHGVGADYIVLCPFAVGTLAGQRKSWPGFPALAARLAAEGLTVLLCPGPGEEGPAQQQFPTAIALNQVPLGTYAALMKSARLVVANDTGPGHLAAAVGAPLVSVLGPTLAAQWAPWGQRVKVVQVAQGWPGVDAVAREARAWLSPSG